ncbi:hypothetical protein [Bacillus atrophaeus]|uniref:hypothetical protein n=1 Tax=Bacillus atrophaeus TaxID=1452 RepID=UPI00227EECFB|nr:hypothetical protein [Bacillus atrophaeus]MCY9165997.1 hypothetical protein [Bacillus atrophaeus]
MHNLKVEIDENLKEKVYKFAGFEFQTSTLSSQEIHYETILEAMDPGPEFKRICYDLELNPVLAAGYLNKYILHLLTDEIRSYIYKNKNSLMKIKQEEIKGQKIHDILNEISFETSKDLFNTLGSIDGFFSSEQIDDRLYNEYDYEDWGATRLTADSNRKWKKNAKKLVRFILICKTCYKKSEGI